MSLPTAAQQLALDVARLGLPFVSVEAKALGTTGLDVTRLGLPFVALVTTSTSAPPSYNTTQMFLIF